MITQAKQSMFCVLRDRKTKRLSVLTDMYKVARIMEAATPNFLYLPWASHYPDNHILGATGKEDTNELSRVATIFKLDLKQYDMLVLSSLKERDAVW